MFGSKPKPSKQSNNTTFASGVAEFWTWFQEVGPRFFETIEQGECASLTDETVAFMESHLPEMSWCFGPGESGGHSFTVTGEGILLKQLLANEWKRRAVELAGWTFYASRQPCNRDDLAGMSITVAEGHSVDTDNIRIKTEVDDEEQLIHIVAWHPALEVVPEEHQMQILFLLLDEALGEFGTQTWLGAIDIQPIPDSTETRSLTELPKFIDDVNKYHQWEKHPPVKTFAAYQFRNQVDAPRGDTIVGSSVIPHVIGDFIENDGRLPDNPLNGTRSELVYLSMDMSVLPEGDQAEVRGNIEDALDDALVPEFAGRSLGGALGTNNAYIDLLLLDGQRSRDLVNATLEKLQLANRVKINNFS